MSIWFSYNASSSFSIPPANWKSSNASSQIQQCFLPKVFGLFFPIYLRCLRAIYFKSNQLKSVWLKMSEGRDHVSPLGVKGVCLYRILTEQKMKNYQRGLFGDTAVLPGCYGENTTCSSMCFRAVCKVHRVWAILHPQTWEVLRI